MKTKPFNLEKAKAGKPVVTREGQPARLFSFNVCNKKYPIVGVHTTTNGVEISEMWEANGKCSKNNFSQHGHNHYDLFMLVKQKNVGWINLYQQAYGVLSTKVIHTSKEEALKYKNNAGYVKTVKIKY